MVVQTVTDEVIQL